MPGSPATTPRLGIPRYSGADAANFPTDWNAGVDQIDLVTAGFSSGVFASRPVASSTLNGNYYWATDTDVLYLCVEAAWIKVPAGTGKVTSDMLKPTHGVVRPSADTTTSGFADLTGATVTLTPAVASVLRVRWRIACQLDAGEIANCYLKLDGSFISDANGGTAVCSNTGSSGGYFDAGNSCALNVSAASHTFKLHLGSGSGSPTGLIVGSFIDYELVSQ
jgi:hypothetical protein